MLLAITAVASLSAKKDKDSVLDWINQRLAYLIKNAKTECVNVIMQADIDAEGGYVIVNSGSYCLGEDIVFDGSTVANPGVLGPIAIAINATDVHLDLKGHTITVIGNNTNAIATLEKSENTWINNGTFIGDTVSTNQAGILALTSDIGISDIEFVNFQGVGSTGITIEGLQVSSTTDTTATPFNQNGIIIARCIFNGAYYAVEAAGTSDNVAISLCYVDSSNIGIFVSAAAGAVTNARIENCSFTDSIASAISSTNFQNNWVISNCRIARSGADAVVLGAFEDLKLIYCQILNTTLNGILSTSGTRNNVEIIGCQVYDFGSSALNLGSTNNFVVRDCEFINPVAPSHALTNNPLMQVNTGRNGLVADCVIQNLANVVAGGLSGDCLVLTSCQGVTVEDCLIRTTTLSTGIKVNGGVSATIIRDCNVSGVPATGILITGASNTGIVVDNCSVQGATTGISLTGGSSNAAVRNNTLTGNAIGINNAGVNSQIYHNFASGNTSTNYVGVTPALVVAPAPGVGTCENISG